MSDYKEISFLRASRQVQNHFSLKAIARYWNASGLGRPAKDTTVRRWLNRGPYTKNTHFEVWVIGLASIFN